MKTKILCLFTLISFLAFQEANAKIWRVNNNGYSADFKTLGEANGNNNVLSGDTIHLEGSATAYDGTAIDKALIIIGSGYFLNENPNTTSSKISAQINYISFNTGSAGSQLKGVYVSGGLGIGINTKNITITRCRIDYRINLSYDLFDIKITQNFFFGQSSASAIVPSGLGFPTDIVFTNNICQKTLIIDNDAYTFQECSNNVFDCPTVNNGPSLKIQAGTFNNNIFTNPNATVNINGGNVTHVANNISASANNQFGTANNNIVVSDMTTLFVGATGNSTDGAYQLKPNSPGSNNGSDGTDRGVFGGLSPANHYTLSGLPNVPVIYEISSSGVAGGSLPVTIKAKTVQ